MKLILRQVMSLALMVGLVATPLVTITADGAAAVDAKAKICEGVQGAGGNGCNTTGGANQLTGFIRSIINILLFIIGAIAVLMIVIGGLRYVLSGGDQSAVNSAKNTILYAVVGLIIALLAYAIVNFVVKAL